MDLMVSLRRSPLNGQLGSEIMLLMSITYGFLGSASFAAATAICGKR